MMDRSNLSVLNAIDDFDGWNTEADVTPKLPRPGTALRVAPLPEFASVALFDNRFQMESLSIFGNA